MTERLSHELASLLAEEEGCLDRGEARDLLRARLARSISEALAQGERLRGGGEAGTIDRARIAAYLDGSMSRTEREAIAAMLADDPVARSDLASALLLLDGIEAKSEPAPAPAGLVARAAGILAPAQPIGPRTTAVRHAPVAIWWRRPAAWSGIAAVLLIAALTPAVVSMVQERNEASSLRDVKGGPTERGIVPSPAGKAKEQNPPSCDGSNERAVDRAAGTSDRPADPSASDDDPCRPKPAIEGDRKLERP